MFYVKFTRTAGKWYFDTLQGVEPDIAHLDVLFMIHDLLHFFHERIRPNFTLVVAKFYNGLRNVHYHKRLNLVSACEPRLRFLYRCCLLWFYSSVLSVEVTVQYVFTITFELLHPKTSTVLPSRNRTRCQKTYECLHLSFNGRTCLSRDVIGSCAKVPTN